MVNLYYDLPIDLQICINKIRYNDVLIELCSSHCCKKKCCYECNFCNLYEPFYAHLVKNSICLSSTDRNDDDFVNYNINLFARLKGSGKVLYDDDFVNYNINLFARLKGSGKVLYDENSIQVYLPESEE